MISCLLSNNYWGKCGEISNCNCVFLYCSIRSISFETLFLEEYTVEWFCLLRNWIPLSVSNVPLYPCFFPFRKSTLSEISIFFSFLWIRAFTVYRSPPFNVFYICLLTNIFISLSHKITFDIFELKSTILLALFDVFLLCPLFSLNMVFLAFTEYLFIITFYFPYWIIIPLLKT